MTPKQAIMKHILGDNAYGAKAIREYITSQVAAYTIPPKRAALLLGRWTGTHIKIGI